MPQKFPGAIRATLLERPALVSFGLGARPVVASEQNGEIAQRYDFTDERIFSRCGGVIGSISLLCAVPSVLVRFSHESTFSRL